MQIDFDAVAASSCEEGKTIFTKDQKEKLQAKFRRKKYPTREEKVELASKLGIGFYIVQVSIGTTYLNYQQHTNSPSFFFVRICFIRISRLKFTRFLECFKNKPEVKILIKIFLLSTKKLCVLKCT